MLEGSEAETAKLQVLHEQIDQSVAYTHFSKFPSSSPFPISSACRRDPAIHTLKSLSRALGRQIREQHSFFFSQTCEICLHLRPHG